MLRRFDLKARVAIADGLLEALVKARHGTLDFKEMSTAAFYDYLDPFEGDPGAQKTLERIIDNLAQVGISRVQRFLAIPATELASRFGSAGLLIRSRILGENEVGWPLWAPEEKVRERLELFDGDRCGELEPLLFHFKPVLERAFSRLWGRGLRASALSLKLSLEKFSTVKEPVREWRLEFLLPQATARGTLPVLRERLARDLSRKPLESSVLAIDLEILQSVKDYQGQRHFFHSKEDIQEAFSSVLSQFAEGLGKDKVFQVCLHEEAVPERSWSRSFTRQKALPELADYVPLRPTRLLRRPERVQIAGDMIYIRKRGYRILKWSSLEQIAAHWIDRGIGQEVVRSYYRLELEGQSPVWIFQCPKPKDDYHLHGYFG